MNYQNIHDRFIVNIQKQNRSKEDKTYYENHHIFPKCLNGTNNKENLVLLTAREHFFIHKLLTKIYPNNKSLIYAFRLMCYKGTTKHQRTYKISQRDLQYCKELIIKNCYTFNID